MPFIFLFFCYNNGEIRKTMWHSSSSSFRQTTPQGAPFDKQRQCGMCTGRCSHQKFEEVKEAEVETAIKNQLRLSPDRAEGKQRQRPRTPEPTCCLADKLSWEQQSLFGFSFRDLFLCLMTWRQQWSGLLGIYVYMIYLYKLGGAWCFPGASVSYSATLWLLCRHKSFIRLLSSW